MLRLISFLIGVALAAAGLAWLADRPGELVVQWQGYQIETSVFRAIILLVVIVVVALVAWSLLRNVWHGPATLGGVLAKRRQQQGIEALSSGMIALGAGDRSAAMRAAVQARKWLPNEPLTHLLRAQAAQLTGDRTTARRIFEAMLASPDTEQLGLRGLFLEAQRVEETEAARHFAQRAVALNPKLNWAVDALFDLQCRLGDWAGALEALAIARKNGQIDKLAADRRRAVLLTAQAQAAEETDPERTLNLALEAHGLAPNLVPAAAVAGRLLAARGNTPRAAKILRRAWSRSPHPDLAIAYAYARIGDSPHDRLDRIKQLAAMQPASIEGPIAVGAAAIEARQYDEARAALEPLLHGRLTQRVATLMARIEGEQNGDKGRVREWLARAASAPRDPAWTADGVVSDRWAPTSPVTGALDAFQWRVPMESLESGAGGMLPRDFEALMALGTPRAPDPSPGIAIERSEPMTAQTIETVPVRDDPKHGKASREATAQHKQPSRTTTRAAEPDVRTVPEVAREGTQGRRMAETRERDQRIFVAPRAPDDPGPDPSEAEEARAPLRPKPA
jgi:HemY protein